MTRPAACRGHRSLSSISGHLHVIPGGEHGGQSPDWRQASLIMQCSLAVQAYHVWSRCPEMTPPPQCGGQLLSWGLSSLVMTCVIPRLQTLRPVVRVASSHPTLARCVRGGNGHYWPCRARPSACDTLFRFCVRQVLCWFAFLPVPALRSTSSATGCPALFADFVGAMTESDFSGSCIIGFGSSPSPMRTNRSSSAGQTRRSPNPRTKSVRTCQGLRPRRVGRALAMTLPPTLCRF